MHPANTTLAARLENLNVSKLQPILPPLELHRLFPVSLAASETIVSGRQTVCRILERSDPRLLIVVGPCSIHDLAAALDYGQRLRKLADQLADTFFIVMRVYFEKPRSTTGWKGLINDPYLDDSFKIEDGLKKARKLLLDLAELGVPCGTEALDPITPQYLSDLVTWSAIGARTTESQTHREMASGLSMPVGIKNGTDGSLAVAINALMAIAKPHSFLGIDEQGACAVVHTKGNRYAHIVLRGGDKPNYDSVSVALCERALKEKQLAASIMIDCSHGNSNKDPALQELVLMDGVQQINEGNRSIIGFMLESNLAWGNQPIPERVSELKYGVSITDACIDWDTTQRILTAASKKLSSALHARHGDI